MMKILPFNWVFDTNIICLHRKRSTTSTKFYKEYFARLPGYPQYDSNSDLELAIYTLVPGTGVLTSDILKSVVEGTSMNITDVLGKCQLVRADEKHTNLRVIYSSE